jgi:chorismate mutase
MVKLLRLRWPRQTVFRAIRGATTVAADDPALIEDAVMELLGNLATANDLLPDDVISAILTATPDLTSTFPASAARRLGWDRVPLLCAAEIAVPGALPRCIRVLLHVSMSRVRQPEALYLRGSDILRPDLRSDSSGTISAWPRR